jgi:hypothetical protein
MPIYELRTYDVIVGKMSEVVNLYKTLGWPALAKHPQRLVGYMTGDVGAMNQLVQAEGLERALQECQASRAQAMGLVERLSEECERAGLEVASIVDGLS